MENNCVNCKKNFSSKESLNLHVKTSACLKKKDKKSFECEYCNKILSTNQMLQYHNDSCEQKKIFETKLHYENIIENLKTEFSVERKEYQNKIADLERRIEYLLPATKYINLGDYNMMNPASAGSRKTSLTKSENQSEK